MPHFRPHRTCQERSKGQTLRSLPAHSSLKREQVWCLCTMCRWSTGTRIAQLRQGSDTSPPEVSRCVWEQGVISGLHGSYCTCFWVQSMFPISTAHKLNANSSFLGGEKQPEPQGRSYLTPDTTMLFKSRASEGSAPPWCTRMHTLDLSQFTCFLASGKWCSVEQQKPGMEIQVWNLAPGR